MVTYLAFLAISLVADQPPKLTTRQTDYFAIDLPADWKLDPVVSEDKKSTLREFSVTDEKSKQIFRVTVETAGPKFISCFCRPWDEYKLYERDGLKYADLTIASLNVRTLKIAGKKYSTDVHLAYRDADRARLDQLIESIRPK